MKILHPTDFSEGASRAAETAVRLARAFDAEVVLVHVLPPLATDEWFGAADRAKVLEARQRWAEESLEREVMKVHRDHRAVRGLLRAGDPPAEIVRAAQDERADLVVMGTHGRSGLPRLILGSVADRVIRTAPCPVVTVRGGRSPDGRAGAAT